MGGETSARSERKAYRCIPVRLIVKLAPADGLHQRFSCSPFVGIVNHQVRQTGTIFCSALCACRYVKQEPSSSSTSNHLLAAYLTRLAVNTVKQGFAKNRTIIQGESPEVTKLLSSPWVKNISENTQRYKRLVVKEWENADWRRSTGWRGNDLIHGETACVRILAYWWDEAEQGLVGVVHFGPNAEVI